MEFRADGTGVTRVEEVLASFTWSAEHGNLTIAYPGEAAETGQYSIVGNTLTLTQGGQRDTFTRQGSG